MRLTKKIWVIILLMTAILFGSAITVLHLMGYLFPRNELIHFPAKNLFDTPAFIEITTQGKKVTLSSNDDSFEEILTLNRGRGTLYDYFYPCDYVLGVSPDSEEIVITYCYEETVEIAVPMRLEDARVPGKNVSFILTGDYNNAFVVNEQPYVFYTALNPSAELIEKAKDLLEQSDELAEPRSAIFAQPSEILLQLNEKTKVLQPSDEGYKMLISANDLRTTASFYTQIEGATYDFISPNTEEHKMIFCYNDPSYKLEIPLSEGTMIVQPKQIIFPASSADPDIFIVKTEEEYLYFTGLTFSYDLMKTAQKYLFDLP